MLHTDRQEFAVTSADFFLYDAFKKSAEALGWNYKTSFTEFEKIAMRNHDCLYFSTHWDRPADFQFSFSNTGPNAGSERYPVFNLPGQWTAALMHAKALIKKPANAETPAPAMRFFNIPNSERLMVHYCEIYPVMDLSDGTTKVAHAEFENARYGVWFVDAEDHKWLAADFAVWSDAKQFKKLIDIAI
jgi:hypothetical protein